MSGSTHAHTQPSARRAEFEPPSRRRFRALDAPHAPTVALTALFVASSLWSLPVAYPGRLRRRAGPEPARPAVTGLRGRGPDPGRRDRPPRAVFARGHLGHDWTGGSASSAGPGAQPDARPGALIGGRPAALAAAFRSIWVASSDSDGDAVQSPHPHVMARIPVGDSPVWLTPDPRRMWVLNREDDTLMRIDPSTNRVSGRPIRVGDDPTAVAWGHRAVWVTNTGDDTLSRGSPAAEGRCNHRRRRPPDRPDHHGRLGLGGQLRGRQRPAYRHRDEPCDRDDPSRRRAELPAHRRSVWVPNSLDGTV